MQTVTIHDAKTNLSKYIAAAKKGQLILIGGYGHPEVKLTRVTPEDLATAKTRDFSVARNKIIESDHSFTDQTDEAVSELLYEDIT